MKHLRKNLTSLAVALVMTAALCAAVVFTGQSAAVAESADANVVRSEPQTQQTVPADASGVLTGAEALPSLARIHILPEAPPAPCVLGPLAGALKAPRSPRPLRPRIWRSWIPR